MGRVLCSDNKIRNKLDRLGAAVAYLLHITLLNSCCPFARGGLYSAEFSQDLSDLCSGHSGCSSLAESAQDPGVTGTNTHAAGPEFAAFVRFVKSAAVQALVQAPQFFYIYDFSAAQVDQASQTDPTSECHTCSFVPTHMKNTLTLH